MRLLFGVRSLPFGAVLIRAAGHLVPLFVSTRASAALNREIRKGRFHEMWFDWVKTFDRHTPLRAPVVLTLGRTRLVGPRVGKSQRESLNRLSGR